MKLTDLRIKALSVTAGQRVFFDDAVPGFGIRVSPRSKTFVVLMRRDNLTRWATLGRYPEPLSLSEARRRARTQLLIGFTAAPPVTFEAACEEYRTRHLSRVRADTAHEQERILRVRFKPVFGKRKLDRLTARDISTIIDDISGNASRRAAFIAMRTFLNWCIRQEYLETSPLSRLQCPRQRTRERVLTDEEVVEVWRGVPSGVYGDIVKLLALTGQRRGQIAALSPTFVRGELLTWPSSRMKSNRTHSIPITPMVAEILARYPKGLPVIKHWAWFKKKLDRNSGIYDWVLHDLRRTFATKLAEMGVAPHIIERILAHSSGTISGVAAIYNRYSFLPEMREALLKWETRLHTLLSNTESTNGRHLSGIHQERQSTVERRAKGVGRTAA